MPNYTHKCSDENCGFNWNDKSIYPTCPSCGEKGVEIDQPQFEPDKFIVINRKHIKQTKSKSRLKAILTCVDNLLYILKCDKNEPWPDNKYIVCNQDEPYADEVLKVILEGERLKKDGQPPSNKSALDYIED